MHPIVAQLVTEPPSALEQYPNTPGVNEFDDLLVECIGQMAVAAGSDQLWKHLNHEVIISFSIFSLSLSLSCIFFAFLFFMFHCGMPNAPVFPVLDHFNFPSYHFSFATVTIIMLYLQLANIIRFRIVDHLCAKNFSVDRY